MTDEAGADHRRALGVPAPPLSGQVGCPSAVHLFPGLEVFSMDGVDLQSDLTWENVIWPALTDVPAHSLKGETVDGQSSLLSSLQLGPTGRTHWH